MAGSWKRNWVVFLVNLDLKYVAGDCDIFGNIEDWVYAFRGYTVTHGAVSLSLSFSDEMIYTVVEKYISLYVVID